MDNRTEFPNLAIVSVILKNFVGPFKSDLEQYYETSDEKFEAVRNAASDGGEDEILAMLDYIERKQLVKTFFPD